MNPAKPRRRPPPAQNRVALDGTLDRVAGMRISILEKGRDAEPWEQWITRRDAVRERIACHNRLCHGLGFSLGDVLRELKASNQPEFIGTSFCTGQELDPETDEPLRSCETRFEVHVQLRYR